MEDWCTCVEIWTMKLSAAHPLGGSNSFMLNIKSFSRLSVIKMLTYFCCCCSEYPDTWKQKNGLGAYQLCVWVSWKQMENFKPMTPYQLGFRLGLVTEYHPDFLLSAYGWLIRLYFSLSRFKIFPFCMTFPGPFHKVPAAHVSSHRP